MSVEAHTFLPPSHQRMLEPYLQFEQGQAEMGSGDQPIHEQAKSQTWQLMIASARDSRSIKKAGEALPSRIRSVDDLKTHLHYQALETVIHDRQLFFIVQNLGVAAGVAEAEGHDAFAWAKEKGEETILFRARHATTELLKASNWLYASGMFEGDPSSVSVWDRTLEAQRRRGAGGPKIVNAAWKEAELLSGKAQEAGVAQAPEPPFKPSRFGLLNLFKAVRHVKNELQAVSSSDELVSMYEAVANPMIAGMNPPLQLDENTIARSVGTLTKTVKHVENAANVDSKIAEDPRTLYLSFLVKHLRSSAAVRTERTAFARLIERTAANTAHQIS